MHKKEAAVIKRQMTRMARGFEGLLDFYKLPGAVFVVDILNEEIAVNEAKRLNIPCIGLVDTNSDPTQVAFPIPGNDDAVRSVRLIVSVISDAIQAGLARREAEASARRAAAPAAKQEIGVAESVEPEVTLSPDLLKDSQLADAKKPARRTGTRKPRAPKAKAE